MKHFSSFSFSRGTTVPYSIVTFLIVLFSAVICAVPRGSQVSFSQNIAIQNIATSNQYRDSLLLSIAVSIPLLVDNILDFVSIIRGSASDKLHWTSRFFLLMSLILPNIYLYSRVMTLRMSASDYLSTITLIRSTSRGCLCIYLSQDHLKLGLGPICASISLCYLIEQLLWLATYVEDNHQLGIVSLTLTGIIHLQLLLIFVKCFVDARQSGREKSADDLCIFVYLSSYLLLSLGSLLIPLAYDDQLLSTATPEKVSLYSYLQIVFTIMAMTVSGRVARFKSLKSETALLEQKAFMRYISHELRTPLNAVFLGMTLVRDELMNICPLAKAYVQSILETVDDVNECCEAAISILNDLLTFDKLHEGKMTLDFEEINIIEYVTESLRPFRAEARQKNIDITMRVEDTDNEGWDQLSALHVDPHRMSQVLRNLLSNAIKFTPSGGIVALLISRVSRREFKHLQKYPASHVRSLKRNAVQPLEITSGANGAAKEILNNCVRIEITDTGAGISEENQKKLFGQYMQFHAGRLQGGKGSGLGLWISKGIVGLHGGKEVVSYRCTSIF